uniref:cytochrome b n=1 Tax=Lottia goshimai TaxID=1824450 RepID=UPI002114AF1F|nr:cytochrome b [Lottia goshimai]UTM92228.1 cytochrome b [Lottia peitaihoensis]
MWKPLYKKSFLWSLVDSSFISLPAPKNLNYWWNFGSLLGLCLVIQISTGLFLSFHYSAHESTAFESVVHIERNVNMGWLLRSVHTNGASAFFFCLYCHIGRGLYYGCYRQTKVWLSGVILLLLTMGIAFLGYVLPWGQMSFWGATVITNLLTAIPLVGEPLVHWIWGGYSVSGVTLTRFYSLHFILPFVLAALAATHIVLLHEKGSSNPLGVSSSTAKLRFHPYYTTKDLLGASVFMGGFLGLVLLKPHLLSSPENFFPANPLSTPAHIQPEWYFLFAYTILRSMPSKSLGVLYMVFSIVSLCFFSFYHTSIFQSAFWTPPLGVLFGLHFYTWVMLTWLGGKPADPPYIFWGQLFSVFYVLFYPLTLLVVYWQKLVLGPIMGNKIGR